MNIKPLSREHVNFYVFCTNLDYLHTLSTYLKNESDYITACTNFVSRSHTKFINDGETKLKLLHELHCESDEVFVYIDYKGKVLDNFFPLTLDDLENFNIYNIAPYKAYAIALFKKNSEDEIYGNPIGYILLDRLKKTFGKRLYRVGLCSDIHYNDTAGGDTNPDTYSEDGSEFYGDTINCMKYYQDKEDVAFVATAGDVGTDSIVQSMNFRLMLNKYAPTTPFYSCYGNHDYNAANKNPNELISDEGRGFGEMTRLQYWNEMIVPTNSPYTLHHYDSDINSKGYATYWFEVPIPDTEKSDIYIFLSVDFGVTNETVENTIGWGCSLAQKHIAYGDNTQIDKLYKYVYDNDIDACENRLEKLKTYDYQFYDPGVLLWFKSLLTRNQDKRIFIFTHLFFSHKTGNNNSGRYYNYAAEDWRISPLDDKHCAYCLSGIQFEFLNKLNNENPNTIWFSGHSHYKWEWQRIDADINISNIEYDYVDPISNEYDETPSRRYLRSLSGNVINTNTAYNVHLPSTCRPLPLEIDWYAISEESAEGAIMDVYEDYVDIRGIIFKNNWTDDAFRSITTEYMTLDTDKTDSENQVLTSNDEYNIIATFTHTGQRWFINYKNMGSNITNHVMVKKLKIVDSNGTDLTRYFLSLNDPYIGFMGTDGKYHLNECNVNIIDGNKLELLCSSRYYSVGNIAFDLPITIYMNASLRAAAPYKPENYINKYAPLAQYRIPVPAT